MSTSTECFDANVIDVKISSSDSSSICADYVLSETLKHNPEEEIQLKVTFYSDYIFQIEDEILDSDRHLPGTTNRAKFILKDLNLALKATFNNYVHEVYANSMWKYEYKIEVRALVKDDAGKMIHVNFPRILRKIRTGKVIRFPTQKLPRNIKKLIHVCFNITRLVSHDNISNDNDSFSILQNSNSWSFKNTSCISLDVGSETFLVHKEILSSRSDVFAAMFKYEFYENNTKIIKIEDFEADVIEEMIRFMYTNEISVPMQHPQDLYAVAHKYQMENLKFKCLEYLIFNLDFSNATSLYYLANLYDIKDLIITLNNFFKKYEQHMVQEVTYRNYLCENINLRNFVDILFLCTKFNDKLVDVKKVAYDFFVNHTAQIFEITSFQDWFHKHKLESYELCKFLVNSKTSSLSISQN